MAIFKCPKCGKVQEYSKFRTMCSNGKVVNINVDNGNEILCEDCKTSMKYQSKAGNFSSNSINKFSSMSPLEKQKILRQRSKEDNKKQGYVANEKEREFYNG